MTLAVSAALVLGAATPALATQRFVAPGGATSSNDCTNSASPCDLTRAVMDVALDQDEVILAPGTYNLSSGLAPTHIALDIHGPAGTQTAQIVANTSGPAINSFGQYIHDLSITQTGSGQALLADGGGGALGQPSGLYENLHIAATNIAAVGVQLQRSSSVLPSPPLLRNSVVTAANIALVTTGDADINNVDAFSSAAQGLVVNGENFNQTINVANSILRGSSSSNDVGVIPGGSGTLTFNLAYSDERNVANGLSGTVNTQNNISSDPLLVGNGDFHETPLSPTIDAGHDTASVLGIGGSDLDWGPRSLGTHPDIGADEMALAPTGSTTAASGVSQNAATLNASINPGGGPTTYHFDYGTSPSSLGSRTSDHETGAGIDPESASAALTGLAPGTTFYFRVAGSNERDSFQGSTLSFTTPTPPASGGGAPAGGGGGGSSSPPPSAKLAVTFKTAKQKLSKKKLVFTLNPSAACKAKGTIALAGKTLAKFSKQLHAGANKLTIKLSAKARKSLAKALKRHKQLALNLKLSFNGAGAQKHSLKLVR
jgi:hypothetical protein